MANSVVVSRDEWGNVVKRYLGTSEFEILSYNLRPLGAGAGFLGDHSLAEITIRKTDNEAKPITLNFFLKTFPQLEGQRRVSEQCGTFKREIDALSHLFVELKSVLNNSGKDMRWMCDCYLVRDEVIVLEDLSIQGFKTISIREPIEYKHAELVLKELVNLHSASLIFEEKHPNQPFRLDSVYGHMLEECFFKDVPDHPGKPYMETSVQGVLHLLQQIINEKRFLEVKDKVDRMIMSVLELQIPSKKYRNVVCHGDLWRNNMLFQEENGKPIAARLVDFQVIRYAPPANDLMCFLYLSTDKSFRDRFASKLIGMYYDHLSNNLKKHGLSAEKVLPWEQLKESCKHYKKLGICLAACYKQIVLLKPENVGKILDSSDSYDEMLTGDRSKILSLGFNNDREYREKITVVIQELIEFIESE